MAKKEEKKKTIEEVLSELNKEYGAGSVIHGNEKEVFTDVISTGSLGLDLALGTKGIPKKAGKIIEMYGWESSGKSTLAQTIIGKFQQEGEKCLLVDAENSLDEIYAKQLGINLEELYLIQLDESAGEGAYNKMERLVQTGDIGLVVIDSYNALQPLKIVQGEIGDSTLGLHARMLNQAVMKCNTLATQYGTNFIFLGQLREKIGVMFGCLHGETLVNFTDGKSIPIKKVVEEKIKGNVWSWNEKLRLLEEKPIVDWHFNGNVNNSNDYIHFETTGLDGQNIVGFTVTPNHKVLTNNGWEEAKNIKIGDKVMSKYTSIVNNSFADFLYGTIVGDSNIAIRKNTTANIKFQDKKNTEYLNWKIEKLSKCLLFNKTNNKYESKFSSELKIIKDNYPNRDTNAFFNNFSNMGLAIWFMDDVHFDNKNSHCRYKLSVKRFKDDRLKLQTICDQFKSLINVNPTFDKSGSIIFNKEDSLKIAGLICKFVPNSMQYKLPLEFRNKYEDFELISNKTVKEEYVIVKSVKFASLKQMKMKGKYDISIQDNHNYLVGGSKNGIIVHNSPETTQGGNALRFYSHIRLRVSRSLTADNSVMDGKDKIGNKTTVKVEKNKLAPPFKTCSFNIMYGEGIDKYAELIEIAHDFEVLKVYGKSITYNDVKHDGETFIQMLKDQPELFEEVKTKVLNVIN